MSMVTYSVRGIALLLVLALLPLGAVAPDMPALQISGAFAGFAEELCERLETTPIDAFARLAGLLHGNGTLEVGISDTETDYGGAKLQWDIDNNAAAIDFSIGGVMPLGTVDGTLLINDKRAAANLSLLGGGYFGVTYETAIDELIEMGLLSEDDLSSINSAIPSYLNMLSEMDVSAFEDSSAALKSVVADFMTSNEPAATEQDGITTYTYTISSEDFVSLLNDLLDVAAEDEAVRGYIEAMMESMYAPIAPYYTGPAIELNEEQELHKLLAEASGDISRYEELEDSDIGIIGGADGSTAIFVYSYDSVIEELRKSIGYIADEDFALSFAASLDKNDRLCGVSFRLDAEENYAEITLDLGDSALDVWSLDVVLDDETVGSMVWEIDGTDNAIILGDGNEEVLFYSEWDSETGDFTLGYEDEWSDGAVTGRYIADTETLGFELALYDIEGIDLTFAACEGAEIADHDYLELSEWLPDMLPMLESMLGFSISEPTTPKPEPVPVFAAPTTAVVYVDGELSDICGYELMDQNYFRLRDIAMALNGTEKQIEVAWDPDREVVILDFGTGYTVSGVEFAPIPQGERGDFMWNGVNLEYILPDETGGFVVYGDWIDGIELDGNNFVKIADVAALVDFGLSWSGSEYAIYIDTAESFDSVIILD